MFYCIQTLTLISIVFVFLYPDPSTDIDSLGMCVNAITGTLKSFFKVLPDPLIPEKLLSPLLDIPGIVVLGHYCKLVLVNALILCMM